MDIATSLSELPDIGSTSFNHKAAVAWLEQQSEHIQLPLARHIFEQLLSNAAQPKQSSGSACSKLCGFVENCSKSASPALQSLAFAQATSIKLFNYFIEWNEQDAHRSMRLVLDYIVSSVTWNPNAETSKAIKDSILSDTISVITLQASRPSTKSSMIALDHFLQKKIVYLDEVLRTYQRLHGNAEEQEALWDSLISRVFAWMELQHVWTVAGKLLVTILTQPWYKDDKLSKHHPKTWHKFILSGLSINPELLEPIKVYIFMPLFRTDPASTLVYLNELTSLQKLTTSDSESWDLNAMLWVALLEAGKKTGVVGEPNYARASGLSILVASPSTTKPFASETLDLLQKYLPSFHEDVDPKIRYDVLGHSRNMIRRLYNSADTLGKRLKMSEKKATQFEKTESTLESERTTQTEGQQVIKKAVIKSSIDTLREHEEFVEWYTNFLKGELAPSASYQRHITALRAMNYFLKSSLVQKDRTSITRRPANLLIDNTWFRSVLDLILDPYDDVREAATSLIMLLQPGESMSGPPSQVSGLPFTPIEELRMFCRKANELALKTARADHCDGAARSQQLLCRWSSSFEEAVEVLEAIFSDLEKKLCAAESDLAAAVLQAPVHGDFASLRYIWSSFTGVKLNQRYIATLDEFQDRAISCCQRVWLTVQHILCDDSPEGHLPEELQQIEGLDTKDLLSYSFRAIHESRSAGIPAIIVGILASKTESPSFNEVIVKLQEIGRQPAFVSETDGSNLAQVHSLNCLKDIFKTSFLSLRAEPYLTDCLRLAASSLQSEVLFGTNESKSAMEAGWDGRTIRISYHKFEALPSLLVNLLEVGKRSSGITIGTQTAEAVFPALDIIRRAGPPEGYIHRLFLLERLLQVMPDELSEVQAVYIDILNFIEKTVRIQPNGLIREIVLSSAQQASGQTPLALLSIRMAETNVQQTLQNKSEESIETLDQELRIALTTDINVACRMLEAISSNDLLQTYKVRSRLAVTYLHVCFATKAPEPRTAAVEGLASLIDNLLRSTSEDGTLDTVLSEETIHALWLDLHQKPLNASLSDAIIRVSGPLMAISLARARGQVDKNIAQRLSSWGAMMSDAGVADRTFDTRIAAVEAINSLVNVVGFPAVSSDNKSDSKLSSAHLPWLLALYDALTDDDVEIREAAAEAAGPILGLSLVPVEANARLLSWFTAYFKHDYDFIMHVAGRMIGHNFGSNCFESGPAEIDGSDWVPAKAQLTEAMRFDDSLFVIEEHNQYIDEVREAKRWTDVFTALDFRTGDARGYAVRALAEWTLAGLRALTEITQSEAAVAGDGPLGWTSKPQVFAICARILICASTLANLENIRDQEHDQKEENEEKAGIFTDVSEELTRFWKLGCGDGARIHGLLLQMCGIELADSLIVTTPMLTYSVLPSDFVYLDGSGFEYTRSLINDGVALPFTAHATSPTITMPRIKAMTTGTTPSFLDAILSFDEADTSSTLASQDTWLAQMKAKNTGKLIMYGDDTWLKLFPGTFDRAEGTTSFFVSDFTEVDNNVTRHIDNELVNDDWNTMILHYLGLDHIGHKTGPRGPNMIPKQREMDAIVRRIYGAMEANEHLRSTLLVLCGDHGMNDAGNHGASSPGETSAALVFISPKLKTISGNTKAPAKFVENFQYYSTVEQSDLAPTLAALLGFPIPKNSLGAFIPDFLPLWPRSSDKLQILIRNARQILAIVTATLGGSFSVSAASEQECLHPGSSAVELVCEWRRVSEVVEQSTTDSAQHQEWLSDISRWLSNAQMLMSSMASNYDIDKMIIGGIITAAAVFAAGVSTAVSTKITIRNFVPFALITLLYGVMMFASSYVEEEQHFWYWSTTAWLFYLVVKRTPRPTGKCFTMMVLGLGMMRLTRSWNQTGQKFAGEPDIVTIFLMPNPTLLWALVWSTYFLVSRELLNDLDGIPTVISGSVVAGVVTSAVSFKLTFTKEDAPELVVGLARILADFFDGPSLATQARAVFMAVHALHHLYTLFALTQSRATNIPLFLLFRGIYFLLNELNLDPMEVTTTSLLLQFASFFAMGGSNAFTGIDLSSAYNGVSDFNIFAVGALTFVSNWAGPVWWTSASNLLLMSSGAKATGDHRSATGGTSRDIFIQHASLLTLYVAVSLGSVMAACTALRTHLFIWTVFSPKYLYSMAWSLGQHLVINMGLGGLLYWLGRT
ncbi:hypothetical protein FHL15_007746 [Xylaria flabelliformis]|uniref:GPI ethanolamine phosphate transferase 2 n=1 Tax=Xylaria flabelliformis TaxID=2512241 RepID=A0A553HTP3_9PEZI|nr:hypothetical protein FHL15_007746 [Xylaria flabelliformis]